MLVVFVVHYFADSYSVQYFLEHQIVSLIVTSAAADTLLSCSLLAPPGSLDSDGSDAGDSVVRDIVTAGSRILPLAGSDTHSFVLPPYSPCSPYLSPSLRASDHSTAAPFPAAPCRTPASAFAVPGTDAMALTREQIPLLPDTATVGSRPSAHPAPWVRTVRGCGSDSGSLAADAGSAGSFAASSSGAVESMTVGSGSGILASILAASWAAAVTARCVVATAVAGCFCFADSDSDFAAAALGFVSRPCVGPDVPLARPWVLSAEAKSCRLLLISNSADSIFWLLKFDF